MQTKTYLVENKNPSIRKQSSSGGVFFCLAKYYLNTLNGVVYGSVIDDSGAVHHTRVDRFNDLGKLLKSKYVFSDLRNCLEECANDLSNNKHVLFVGTPCQAAALKNYLMFKHINQSKLLIADLFCHGAPQKKYWLSYLSEQFSGEHVLNVDFRRETHCNKKNLNIFIRTNKRQYSKNFFKDPYMFLFMKNYILSYSCFHCTHKGENRAATISLGDFWGLENFYSEYSYFKKPSLVVVRNDDEKGKKIIEILSSDCRIIEVSYSLSLLGNIAYQQSVEKPHDLDVFEQDYNNKGFLFSYKSCLKKQHKEKKNHLKNFIKWILAKNKKYVAPKEGVGIITDYGYSNYGNRLQNYALSYVLKKYNFVPININNAGQNKYYFLNFLNFIKLLFRDRKTLKRSNNIKRATKKYKEKNFTFLYNKKGKKSISTFNRIILGSDQIWNWSYNKNSLCFNLGLFGSEYKGIIFSYAASFGESYIPDSFEQLYREGLSGIKAIGVRENTGVDIVNRLGFKGVLNADPTMLLTKNEWDNAVYAFSKMSKPNQKYILRYTLKYNEPLNINQFSDYLCVDILSKKSPYYEANQFDFIKLIKYSELVVTDSYHAIVFSIIFGKKAIVLPRNNMASRIETLFNFIGIKYQTNEIIDFSRVSLERLEQLKCDSIDYLLSNLK